MRDYKTVQKEAEIEIVINKSRFIGRCFPVGDEGEALAVLAGIRKRHWDASHNCFAYRIGETGAAARFSDDGEPGGTAGKPIMDVLLGKDIVNVMIVVTRYFGGVLLGAGGLVRAYSRAAAEACGAAGLAAVRAGVALSMTVDYSRYGVVEGLLRERGQITDTEFGENVTLRAMVRAQDAADVIAAVVDKTDGRCTPSRTGEAYMRERL
ncbi:MAG: YigZ family protein [Eubacteriales bacterium]|nr:YigZ family protein [Eubacteriales bacterium]